MRATIGRFIFDASQCINKPFFTIHSNSGKSLCMLMSFTPQEYSALLIAASLVKIHVGVNGNVQFWYLQQDWIDFLIEYKLQGLDGKGGCSKINCGYIYLDAMEDSDEELPINCHEIIGMFMAMIRVGWNTPGLSFVSTKTMNNKSWLP